MNGIYSEMAKFYDSLNSGLDYKAWADFAVKAIEKYSKTDVSLILDAACGTGSMTLELARRGYDMTGVDLSPEMLTVARQRAAEEDLDILLLCQDLGEIELYGTVDCVTCCLDSVNHILAPESLERFFELLHTCYLSHGGLLIFDINTPYKFENIYGTNDFILEEEGMLCAWQNFYDRDEGVCHFYLSLFSEDEDGRYSRTDMEQCERVYTKEEICDMLSRHGFETVGIFSDYDFSSPSEEDERLYFVARNT